MLDHSEFDSSVVPVSIQSHSHLIVSLTLHSLLGEKFKWNTRCGLMPRMGSQSAKGLHLKLRQSISNTVLLSRNMLGMDYIVKQGSVVCKLSYEFHKILGTIDLPLDTVKSLSQ